MTVSSINGFLTYRSSRHTTGARTLSATTTPAKCAGVVPKTPEKCAGVVGVVPKTGCVPWYSTRLSRRTQAGRQCRSSQYAPRRDRSLRPGSCTLFRWRRALAAPMTEFGAVKVLRWLETVDGLTGAQRAAIRAMLVEVELIGQDLLEWTERGLPRMLRGTGTWCGPCGWR